MHGDSTSQIANIFYLNKMSALYYALYYIMQSNILLYYFIILYYQ